MAVTREKVVALGAAVIVAAVVPGTLGYATERIAVAEQARSDYARIHAASGRPISEPCGIHPRTTPPVRAERRRDSPAEAPRAYPRNRQRDRGWTRKTEREKRSPARPLDKSKTRRPKIPTPDREPIVPTPPSPTAVPEPTRLPLGPTGHRHPSPTPAPESFPPGYGHRPAPKPSMTYPPRP